MELVLSEDQELIAKTARDFVAERAPLSRTRELRDAGEEGAGFSDSLWKEMAEMGWVGISLPESVGGGGMGYAEMVLVMEALGRTLAPEPFLAAVLSGEALSLGGDAAQREKWLTPLAAGESLVSLAFEEAGARWNRQHVATRAEASGEGFRIRGEKIGVLDGHAAEAFVVSARTSGDVQDAGGIDLFVVPADAPGVSRQRQIRVDSRGSALVSFDVEVPGEARIGGGGTGGELLDRVLDRATVALCGEMLGGMQRALEMTLDYMKEREQFGVRIGSFQALKHRAARLFIDVELARSTVMAAARAVDEGVGEAAALVSLAKAQCSEAYVHVADEAVQIYGGVGMTDEYDIGFFMKRARAAELTFGDGTWHRDRWARCSGY